MENVEIPQKQIFFLGSGSKLFGIYIVNLLLTVITLGLYYPWAKASVLKYLYQETEIEGSRFMFHGTGKEMFLGFIKAIGVFAVLYAILIASMLSAAPTIKVAGFITYFVGLVLLIPVAIHGSLKYRMSRTSWRGTHFGYRGELGKLAFTFLKGMFLTLITGGIYASWFNISLRRYLFSNIRFGNIEFAYEGDGFDLFVLVVKGYILTILTLGIYFFWFAKDLINYYIDNIRLKQDGREIRLQCYLTGGEYFKLAFINIIIILFSLGLAAPWATVRTLKVLYSNILIEGELDLDALVQTEKSYKNATGEDVADMLDLGVF